MEMNLKSISRMVLAFFILMFVHAGSAQALTINSGAINVGGLDTLLTAAYVHPPSDANQISWMESFLGIEVVEFLKIEDMAWIPVDGSTTMFAHALTMDPGPTNYLIKTGTPYNQYSFLYENNPAYNWAVIDLALWGPALGLGDVINIGALSHISQVNPIPEPTTMLLFGTGLAGLAGLGRRRMKKS
jgi:hypothetical protein